MFANSDGNATSKFHTYCIAMGSPKMDHELVINYYSKEMERLMKGEDVWCGQTGTFKLIQMGILVYICNQPERSQILNTLHLGNFGKRSLWLAVVQCGYETRLPHCTDALILQYKDTSTLKM